MSHYCVVCPSSGGISLVLVVCPSSGGISLVLVHLVACVLLLVQPGLPYVQSLLWPSVCSSQVHLSGQHSPGFLTEFPPLHTFSFISIFSYRSTSKFLDQTTPPKYFETNCDTRILSWPIKSISVIGLFIHWLNLPFLSIRI